MIHVVPNCDKTGFRIFLHHEDSTPEDVLLVQNGRVFTNTCNLTGQGYSPDMTEELEFACQIARFIAKGSLHFWEFDAAEEQGIR